MVASLRSLSTSNLFHYTSIGTSSKPNPDLAHLFVRQYTRDIVMAGRPLGTTTQQRTNALSTFCCLLRRGACSTTLDTLSTHNQVTNQSAALSTLLDQQST
jgi:hypothetical protein